MNEDFHTVYESDHGQPVRLEVSRSTHGVNGTGYPHHRLVIAEGRTGAVFFAIHDRHVLLVLSARKAAVGVLWELPRGVGDPGETVLETALRELREETGLHGHSARLLGRYVTDSSIFPQPVAVVSCEVDSRVARSSTDGEISGQQWIPIADIPKLVNDGTLADAHTLAAITMFWSGEGDR